MQAQIQELFREIHAREITDKELQRILTICRTLNINKNDAFISVLASLELYGSAFDQKLEKINDVTDKAALQSAEKTKEHLAEIEKQIVSELANRVDRSAEKLARHKSKNDAPRWIKLFAVFSITTMLCIWFFFAGQIVAVKHEIEKGHHILSDERCTENAYKCYLESEYRAISKTAKVARALSD